MCPYVWQRVRLVLAAPIQQNQSRQEQNAAVPATPSPTFEEEVGGDHRARQNPEVIHPHPPEVERARREEQRSLGVWLGKEKKTKDCAGSELF